MTNSEHFRNFLQDGTQFTIKKDQFDLALQPVYQGRNETVLNDNIYKYASVTFLINELRFSNETSELELQNSELESRTNNKLVFEFNLMDTIPCESDRYGDELIG